MQHTLTLLTIFAAFFCYTECTCPQIISRSEWGALSPKSKQSLRTNPPPYVVVHHSETPECNSRSACQSRIQNIQSYHMNDRQWSDIGYNFLIGGDGNIYEGRGWGIYGAHVPKYNSRSIGICLIGSFQVNSPPENQLQALKDLVSCGVEQGKIVSNLHLIGHRQGGTTQCPGDKLYNYIKTDTQWDPNPN